MNSLKIVPVLFLFITICIAGQSSINQWVQKSDMPTARAHAHAVPYKNSIYVFGGDNSGAVEVYTPSKNSWEIKKSFPGKELNWSGVGLIGDDIYAVIGIGARDNTKYHLIAKYSLPTDTWIRIDSTHSPLNDPGVAITEKSIYIISGYIDGKNTFNSSIPLTNIDTVKEYNLVTKQWNIKASIPTKRHTPFVTVINSKIFVFGGVDETFRNPPSKKVEVYDPQNDTWTSKNEMISGMAYFRAGRIGNTIYFPDEISKKIVLYNVDSDSWIKEQSIPYTTGKWAAASLNNVLYIFGGELYQNNIGIPSPKTSGYVPKGMVMDYDGNVYRPIKIGDQIWMSENLKVTHYNNGDEIPEISNVSTWANLTTGAYCNYNNDINNGSIYGRLYNYYTIIDDRNLCPPGWHVASDDEWKTLEMYLGMSQVQADEAGWRGTNQSGKLKEAGTSHWNSPNSDATNESGFSALPGGGRNESGEFVFIQDLGYWWTSTVFNIDSVWRRDMGCSYSFIDRSPRNKKRGLSIRCIKDNTTGLENKERVFGKINSFLLSQNYPNPFNPETIVDFQLPVAGRVELKVFDMLGREVATIVNGEQPAGSYQVKFNGSKLASGIYMYKIKAGDFLQTKKMVLAK